MTFFFFISAVKCGFVIQSLPFVPFAAGICGSDQPEGEVEEDWSLPTAQEDERAGGGRAPGEASKIVHGN